MEKEFCVDYYDADGDVCSPRFNTAEEALEFVKNLPRKPDAELIGVSWNDLDLKEWFATKGTKH